MQEFAYNESLKDITINKKEDDITHFFDFNQLDQVIDYSVTQQ